MTERTLPLPEQQMGPAEKTLDLVLNSSAHLWHNRPGVDVDGKWHPRKGSKAGRGAPVEPGLFVPAATSLYSRLLEIRELNSVYEKKSARMLTPKGVLRVGQLLKQPEIAELNRLAGFCDPSAKKPPMGRYKRAVTKWLAMREQNLPMLEGLVAAGYKETIKKIARKVGYKPQRQTFFEVLGWKQKQAEGGHREIGMSGLALRKRERFDGLSEAEICENIETQKLAYKEVVGRLPKEIGLTPAIMGTLLPSLSDRDLRQLTPTLEGLGLMTEPLIRERWEHAIEQATDQRALNIAKSVRNKEVREKLEEAADHAVRKAVEKATTDTDVRVMFLIDKSGSMEGAIEQSKEALSRVLAGFPPNKLHIATFDTIGTVLRPKAPTRTGVEHMLKDVSAAGGTMHWVALAAMSLARVRIPDDARLVVIVVGDEAGETGASFAESFARFGYKVDALALMVNVAYSRGTTVRDCARTLAVPFSEVSIEQLDDPYQVPRVLNALLDAPRIDTPTFGLVERVMSTELLTLD